MTREQEHADGYPILFNFRINKALKKLLAANAKAQGCSPSTWLRQAIRGAVVAPTVKTDVKMNVNTVEDTETNKFLRSSIGFRTTPKLNPNPDASFAGCEEATNYTDPELLEFKPNHNPRMRLNQPPLAEDVA